MATDELALPQGMKRDGEKRCPFGRIMTIIVGGGQVRGVDQAPTCAGRQCAFWREEAVVNDEGCLFAAALKTVIALTEKP